MDHVGLLELAGENPVSALDTALGQIQTALRETGTAAVLVAELNKTALKPGALDIAAPRGSARFASLAGALLALVRDENESPETVDPALLLRLLKRRHGRAYVEQGAQLLGGLGLLRLVPGARAMTKGG
ncbi:MAG: hypothetical protein IPM18_12065 [Phycisphaerales bacterium]|nr:hypothetical protein [Phycisphaerales bacterium]